MRSWPARLGVVLTVAGVSARGGPVHALKPPPPRGHVVVPDIVGHDALSACMHVTSIGLSCGAYRMEPSAQLPRGDVIATDPPAGTAVVTGSTVDVVVASSGGPVLVPNVLGESQDAAVASLSSMTLKAIERCKATHAPAQNGTVVSQSPDGGAAVLEQSTVTIGIARSSCQ